MDQAKKFVEPLASALGIDPSAVILGGVILLLAVLFSFRRNAWGTVKFLVILGLLGGLSYFSYRLVVVGLEKKEALIENSDVPADIKP